MTTDHDAHDAMNAGLRQTFVRRGGCGDELSSRERLTPVVARGAVGVFSRELVTVGEAR